MLDVGASHTAQLGGLDDPPPTQALDHLLAADVERQIVREPVVAYRERGEHGRFVGALFRVLEDNALIKFASRLSAPAHGRNQHQRAHRVGVLGILRTAVVAEPFVDALDAIPVQAVEIVPNGMEAVQLRYIAYYG